MTRRDRTLTDLSFLLFVCVFVLAVQWHDHALWFQQPDRPGPAVVGHGR